MVSPELTLIVAATRDMGIGKAGGLPWSGLKKEMAYFARVTKHLPPQTESSAINAVIMGRKTWESIPPKFRPLKGRLNIVISRTFESPSVEPKDITSEPVRASSLTQAMSYLRQRSTGHVGRAFIIGGGQIYAAALELQETKRILLTSIQSEFDCDTSFSIKLDGANASWRQAPTSELEAWTGEQEVAGLKVENDVPYEFQMWEKVDR